jgi:hypothetical protein
MNEVALLQGMAHIQAAVSCKTLVPKMSYRVVTLQKVKSNFSDDMVLIATLQSDDVEGYVRVFLPSRIEAARFTEDFIEAYNKCVAADKFSLIFNGMVGRCIDVQFIKA